MATNAVKLVDYAARVEALTPAFIPGPHEWMYQDEVQKIGPRRDREMTWFEANWSHMYALWPNRRLTPVGSSPAPDSASRPCVTLTIQDR